MGLFSPGWKSKNLDRALACVDRISDNGKLERILQEAPEPMVRRRAAERLTDEERIRRLAVSCPNSWVRCALAEKVSDQALLRQIADNDPELSVRRAAVQGITDQEYLMQRALHTDDERLAIQITSQLDGRDRLVRLAASTGSDDLARACLLRISASKVQEAHLVMGVMSNREAKEGLMKQFGIDASALEKKCVSALGDMLSPEDKKLLGNGRSVAARRFALPYLSPADVKHRIHLESNEELRAALLRSLSDTSALLNIATSDCSSRCRVIALESLRDRKLYVPEHRDALYAIASGDDSWNCRDAAYKLLLKLKKRLDTDWWSAHIDEDAFDQRLPKLVRDSATDANAAMAVARLIVEGKNDDYLHSHCNMPVVEALEKMVSGGDTKAAKALYVLYTTSGLNPALKGHAEAQKSRFTSTHRDGMVDSSVCGELYTHSDWYSNWSIRPL